MTEERVMVFIDGSNFYRVSKASLGRPAWISSIYTGHSRHLRQTCDRFILLDKAMMEKCWLGNRE